MAIVLLKPIKLLHCYTTSADPNIFSHKAKTNQANLQCFNFKVKSHLLLQEQQKGFLLVYSKVGHKTQALIWSICSPQGFYKPFKSRLRGVDKIITYEYKNIIVNFKMGSILGTIHGSLRI